MLQDKLQSFIDRYDEINRLLASEDIVNDIKKMTTLSKEQSDISKIVEAANEYNQVLSDIEENKMLFVKGADDSIERVNAEELIKDIDDELESLESIMRCSLG